MLCCAVACLTCFACDDDDDDAVDDDITDDDVTDDDVVDDDVTDDDVVDDDVVDDEIVDDDAKALYYAVQDTDGWQITELISGSDNVSGPNALVIDSAGTRHVLYGGAGGLWHGVIADP